MPDSLTRDEDPSPRDGNRRAVVVEALLLSGALATFAWDALALHPQLDDSYIAYRYARNLIEGAGLVWNPGEYVEGITNLLWTLMVAGGLALGFAAERVGQVLGLISGLGMLLASHVYARCTLPRSWRWAAGVVPWVVLASASTAYYGTNGMETPLVVALSTAGLAAQRSGRPWTMTLCVALLTLTRPDGLLLAAILFGFYLFGTPWRQWRSWGPPLSYVAVLAGLTAFRLAYYGSPVPNTFFAKVGGLPLLLGVETLGFFLWDGAFALLLPAAFAVHRDRRLLPAAVFIVLTALYVVAVSKSGVVVFCFLLPALPALAVLALCGAVRAWEELRPSAPLLVACVAAALLGFAVGPRAAALAMGLGALGWGARVELVGGASRAAGGALAVALLTAYLALGLPLEITDLSHPLASAKRSRVVRGKRSFDHLLQVRQQDRIRYLEPLLDENALVAAAAIGYFGYRTGLPVLDYLGLVDREVAHSSERPEGKLLLGPGHQRSDADYVFSRKPAYILIAKRDSQPTKALPAVVAIWNHPELELHYEYDERAEAYRRIREIPRPSGGDPQPGHTSRTRSLRDSVGEHHP